MNVDAELWSNLGQIAVLAGVGGYAAWKARRADQQTRGTGNGFAKEVKASLKRIEKKVDRTQRKVDDHIDAHADAEIHHRRPWRRRR